MGRPQTIFIDEHDLLAGIHAAEQAEVRHWRKIARRGSNGDHFRAFQEAHRELRWLDLYGIKFNVAEFLQRDLTPSETIRAQQAARRLEAAGLIEVDGQRASWVRMTAKGKAALKAKPEPATEPAKCE